VKKISSIVLLLTTLAPSLIAAQTILPQCKCSAAQAIPTDFYQKSAHRIIERFGIFNQQKICAFLIQRIKGIAQACSKKEDYLALYQEYVLLDYYADMQIPDYEDCFWWTIADCAKEYAEVYIRLTCNCKEKSLHIIMPELSELLDDLPLVSNTELASHISNKISQVQIMRIHVHQFSKLAESLLEIFNNQQTKKNVPTDAQSPNDGSAQIKI
jgi:hypothetical protein